MGVQATFPGAVINDPRRLKRLMQTSDPAIYPGEFVLCVYSPENALCRKRQASNQTELPDATDCEPFACRNVALDPSNRNRWQHEHDRLDRQLTTRTLPPYLQHQLRQRKHEIAQLLNRHLSPEEP